MASSAQDACGSSVRANVSGFSICDADLLYLCSKVGEDIPPSEQQSADTVVRDLTWDIFAMANSLSCGDGLRAENIVMHGVVFTLTDSQASFCAYVQHIFSRQCVGATQMKGYSVTNNVWRSPNEMAAAIVTHLLDTGKDDTVSLDCLRSVSTALLGYSLSGLYRENILSHIRGLRWAHHEDATLQPASVMAALSGLERMNKGELHALARSHGINLLRGATSEDIHSAFVMHVTSGKCGGHSCSASLTGCSQLRNEINQADHDTSDLRLYVLSAVSTKVKLRPLRRILQANNIPFELNDSLSRLRTRLHQYIRTLRKGKNAARIREHRLLPMQERARFLDQVRSQWPQPIDQSIKDSVVQLFKQQTGRESLQTFTCACCAEDSLVKERREVMLAELPLDLLNATGELASPAGEDYSTSRVGVSTVSMPFSSGPLQQVLLDPKGVC